MAKQQNGAIADPHMDEVARHQVADVSTRLEKIEDDQKNKLLKAINILVVVAGFFVLLAGVLSFSLFRLVNSIPEKIQNVVEVKISEEVDSIPKKVNDAIDSTIGDETLERINDADAYSRELLGNNLVYGYVHVSGNQTRFSGTTTLWSYKKQQDGTIQIELTPPVPNAVVIASPVNNANRMISVNTTTAGDYFDVSFYTIDGRDSELTIEDATSSFCFVVLPAQPPSDAGTEED